MTLDRLLYRLLYGRAWREQFRRGDWTSFGLSPPDAEALALVDGEQLERIAQRTCLELFERAHRGTGSLKEAFARTIDAWQRQNHRLTMLDLALQFAESSDLDDWSPLPGQARGICLEEAFLRFADRHGIGDPAVRKEECATAVLRSLAITPRPSFRPPDFVCRAPAGFFVVLDQGPTLVAAVQGKLLQGHITSFVAALLLSDGLPDAVARRFDVPAGVLEASLQELRRLGLVVC